MTILYHLCTGLPLFFQLPLIFLKKCNRCRTCCLVPIGAITKNNDNKLYSYPCSNSITPSSLDWCCGRSATASNRTVDARWGAGNAWWGAGNARWGMRRAVVSQFRCWQLGRSVASGLPPLASRWSRASPETPPMAGGWATIRVFMFVWETIDLAGGVLFAAGAQKNTSKQHKKVMLPLLDA